MRIVSLVILLCTLAFLSSCDQSTDTPNDVTQGISGTVRSSESGAPVSNAEIWLTNIDSAEVLVDSAITSSTGTYQFKDLKAGRYKIYCFHDDYFGEEVEAVVTANSNMVVNFDLEQTSQAVISFHVRNAMTKKPIQGAFVDLLSSSWSGVTDKNGNLNYDGNHFGDIDFDISADGYISFLRKFDDVGGGITVYDTIDLADPKDFLVASYYFSNNFVDSSGKGNHGTNHGIAWTADRFGSPSSAIYCDGTTDYVSVEDAPSLNFGKGDFTICAWVSSSAPQNSSYTCFVVDKSTLISNVFTGYQVSYVVGTNTRTAVGTTYGPLYAQAYNIGNDNLWHLYTVVVKRSGVIDIYYDGELVDSEDDINGNLPGNINTTAKLLIGGNGTTKNAFKGKIDDIKLFNVALDQKAILAVYHENGW